MLAGGPVRSSTDVLRASPASHALRDAFRTEATRRQRRSDGTISLAGVRFEIPARYRHFHEVTVRYARWDLGRVDLVDPREGTVLASIYPLDKTANADARRAILDPEKNETRRNCWPMASRRKSRSSMKNSISSSFMPRGQCQKRKRGHEDDR